MICFGICECEEEEAQFCVSVIYIVCYFYFIVCNETCTNSVEWTFPLTCLSTFFKNSYFFSFNFFHCFLFVFWTTVNYWTSSKKIPYWQFSCGTSLIISFHFIYICVKHVQLSFKLSYYFEIQGTLYYLPTNNFLLQVEHFWIFKQSYISSVKIHFQVKYFLVKYNM